MEYPKGETRIFFIRDNGIYKPIGCLISNNFEEDVEMLSTTTRVGNGWRTAIPTIQSYRIPVEAIQFLNDTTKLSYKELKIIKRSRQKIEWAIGESVTNLDDTGEGHITEIGESNQVGEILTFSMQVEGYGEPLVIATTGDLWQDGNTMLFQDGNTIIFQ